MPPFSPGDRLIVLGAGATKAAKWESDDFVPECEPPLNRDFFTQLQRIRSKHSVLVRKVIGDVVDLFGPNFSLTLEDYFTQLEFLRTALDWGPEGSAITKKDVREKSDRLRAALSAVLEASTDSAIRRAGGCRLHNRLVTELLPKDAVITFNYDCVLDHALRTHGATKWSAKYGYTFTTPSRIAGHKWWDADSPPSSSQDSIRLLKLHGSLNWQLPLEDGGEIKLKQRLHQQSGVPRFSIVPPVWNKADYREPAYRDLWRHAEACIRKARRIAVVGFSFTPGDLHVESLFRVALARRRDLETLVIANPSPSDRSRIREVFSGPLREGTLVRQYDGFAEFVDSFPGCFD